MPVNVIDTLKPKNNGTFPVVEAVDVAVSDELRLPEALEAKADASALATTNAALAGKADSADVVEATTNLQAQIDQLITPVTEDAEVQNARVGVDGTTYATLKQRLDTEIGMLQDSIDESYTITDITVEQGAIGGSSGKTSSSNNYVRTANFIKKKEARGYIPSGIELKMFCYSSADEDDYLGNAVVIKRVDTVNRNITPDVVASKCVTGTTHVKFTIYTTGAENFSVSDYEQAGAWLKRYIPIKDSLDEEIADIRSDMSTISDDLDACEGEVQSARAGADSTSYETLKARLDAENAAVQAEIASINTTLDDTFTKVTAELVQGALGGTSGAESANLNYIRTDKFIPKEEAYAYIDSGLSLKMFCYSSADVSGFLGNVALISPNTSNRNVTPELIASECEEGTKYVKFTVYITGLENFSVADYEETDSWIKRYIPIRERVAEEDAAIRADIADINGNIDAMTKYDEAVEQGSFGGSTGEKTGSNNYVRVSEFIDINAAYGYIPSGLTLKMFCYGSPDTSNFLGNKVAIKQTETVERHFTPETLKALMFTGTKYVRFTIYRSGLESFSVSDYKESGAEIQKYETPYAAIQDNSKIRLVKKADDQFDLIVPSANTSNIAVYTFNRYQKTWASLTYIDGNGDTQTATNVVATDCWNNDYIKNADGDYIAQGNTNFICKVSDEVGKHCGITHGCEVMTYCGILCDGEEIDFDNLGTDSVILCTDFRMILYSDIYKLGGNDSNSYTTAYPALDTSGNPIINLRHRIETSIKVGNIIEQDNKLISMQDGIQFSELYGAMLECYYGDFSSIVCNNVENTRNQIAADGTATVPDGCEIDLSDDNIHRCNRAEMYGDGFYIRQEMAQDDPSRHGKSSIRFSFYDDRLKCYFEPAITYTNKKPEESVEVFNVNDTISVRNRRIIEVR